MTTDERLEDIRAWLQSVGLGRKRLCRMAGLGERSLQCAFSPEWNPTAETLRKLERLRAVIEAGTPAEAA